MDEDKDLELVKGKEFCIRTFYVLGHRFIHMDDYHRWLSLFAANMAKAFPELQIVESFAKHVIKKVEEMVIEEGTAGHES